MIGAIAGIVTIMAYIERPSANLTVVSYLIAGCCIVGVIGLFLDFKSRGEQQSELRSAGQGQNEISAGELNTEFFVGLWETKANSQYAETFLIELRVGGKAIRHGSGNVAASTGHWECIAGEAIIQWSDPWRDVIRQGPLGMEKLALWDNEPMPRDISPVTRKV